MSSKLFVGGLSFGTDDASLRAAFEPFGELTEARVVLDRETGRSRGFGFVAYKRPEDARGAIERMRGVAIDGRVIRVDLAEDKRGPGGPPREGGFRSDRPQGGGYGGGGGGGYGGGGYGGGGGGYGGGGGGYGGGGGGGGYGGGGGGYRSERPGGFGGPPRDGGYRSDRPAGPGDRPAFGQRPVGDRPPPRRTEGTPGGTPFPRRPSPGGFSPPPEEEGAWDDARIRRVEPKKHRERAEPEAERKAVKAPGETPKRASGRSWRQWDLDDEDDDAE